MQSHVICFTQVTEVFLSDDLLGENLYSDVITPRLSLV